MEPERYPASSETDTLHSLARLVAAYLRDDKEESLPSKQGVEGSNPFSRSTDTTSTRIHT
jgi:hypothetical protein